MTNLFSISADDNARQIFLESLADDEFLQGLTEVDFLLEDQWSFIFSGLKNGNPVKIHIEKRRHFAVEWQ